MTNERLNVEVGFSNCAGNRIPKHYAGFKFQIRKSLFVNEFVIRNSCSFVNIPSLIGNLNRLLSDYNVTISPFNNYGNKIHD